VTSSDAQSYEGKMSIVQNYFLNVDPIFLSVKKEGLSKGQDQLQ
jgi:hypothetical protein